jgi:hypothetical protein
MSDRKEINGYTTRSFIAMLAAVIITVARIKGYDLGFSENQLIELGLQLAPLVFGIWAYVERIYGKCELVFNPARLKDVES